MIDNFLSGKRLLILGGNPETGILVDIANSLGMVNMEHAISDVLGEGGYMILGTAFFVGLAFVLYRIATKKD